MSPRRMEEASVAGESPDKSEQRKSSETTEERDPRFAVFREPAASAGAGSTAGRTAGAGTDTATAVFRAPRSEGADARAQDDGDDDVTDVPGSAPDSGDASSRADQGGEDGGPAADGAGKGSGGPRKASAPAGGTEEPGDAVRDPGASEAPSGDAAEAGAGSGSEDADEDADENGNEAANGHDSDDSDGPDDSDDSDGPDDSEVTSGPGTDADAEAATGESARTASDTSKDARLRSAVAAWVAGDDEADGPETEPKSETEAARESKPGSKSEPKPQPETSPGENEAAGTPRVPRSREEATGPDRTAPGKEEADASAEDEAETSEPAGDKRGIDQPTAVFKAPRPQVDQPTTALKLPPRAAGAKTGAKAAKAAKAEAKAAPDSTGSTGSTGSGETPAERTSKFVPLRSDDVRPAEPAPSRTPDASGASGSSTGRIGPTVTPDVRAGATGPAAGYVEAERTRQQPMPPKPPLDLLAELTNTPPPPETPVRTAVRRVKIWTPLVLLLLIVFAIAQAVRPLPDPTLSLSAAPTYTFGGEKLVMPWPEEGQGAVEVEGVGAIGSYGKEKPAPIASMAKVMTAYVILQGHPITGDQKGEQIEVDEQAGKEAAITDESTAAIEKGDKFTEYQMLQMLMIPSGNNVARLLARWDAGTEKAFIEKMNAAAKDLGMTNTTYTDPSGLKASTMSTPADQITLGKAVMRNDVFREVVDMPQADIPGVGRIYNNNYILLEDGVNGIKTGSSTPAGGNLLWTANTVVDGKPRRIIGAVMGATVEGILEAKLERARQNSLKLIKAAQKGVDSATVVKKGQVVGYVDNGFGARTPVVATKDLKAVGWGGLQVDLELTDGGRTPAHEAEAGTVVGQVSVGAGTGKVSVPVALRSAMTEPGFGDKLTRIS
ncbi:D-alanyl-D-alanine carboxypeptidase [Streptomyces sp. SID8358]|uniref:D-alanyl-D-alanine carboxypeptidase n=1 Tax=Streptomyces sp. SID8358 TaxID=2690342 RepID=UPI000DAC4102|nr:D-alanyl-D-alanine carboxypeptidase [Streptomyces sp. SID8358]MYU36888.1 D-alanyl-D-alanine carboxypeptidase [Streptomyces sp. SID8358]